jgi:hypothetical protein
MAYMDDDLGDLLDDIDLEDDVEAPQTLQPDGGDAVVTQDSMADLLSQLDDDEAKPSKKAVPVVSVTKKETKAPAHHAADSSLGGLMDDLDGLDGLESEDGSIDKTTPRAAGGGLLSVDGPAGGTGARKTERDDEREMSLPSMSAGGLSFRMSADDLGDLFEDGDLDDEEVGVVQDAVDEGVMKLLHRDFRDAKTFEKNEELRKMSKTLKGWSASKLESKIIKVSDAISIVNRTEMYDTKIGAEWEDEDKQERYRLTPVEELSTIQRIPRKYFNEKGGGTGGGGTAQEVGHASSIDNEELGHSPSLLDSGGLGVIGSGIGSGIGAVSTVGKFGVGVGIGGLKMAGKLGKGAVGGLGLIQEVAKDSEIVCAGCGNPCEFKRKNRHKDHYVAYRCEATLREYLFHDKMCVNLRVIKEAIRRYVFIQSQSRSSIRMQQKTEAAFVSIDKDANMHRNKHEKPLHFTTPINDTADYKEPIPQLTMMAMVEEKKQADETGIEDDVGIGSRLTVHAQLSGKVSSPYFRRYRTHVAKILERLSARAVRSDEVSADVGNLRMKAYSERFGSLPAELMFCDLNEYGVPIFEFVSDALKSKYRRELWDILRFISLELGTVQVLEVLQSPRHTHLLTKHMLQDYDELAKCIIEGSRFPIAASLRLSAFMYERAEMDLSNQDDFREIAMNYLDIGKKMLKEIESDHLFTILLQMPTDINHDSIIDIALKYNLIFFLEDPRIVRVFGSVWSGGIEILRPEKTLQDLDLNLDEFYQVLRKEPGRFYFSARGKFYVSSSLYWFYLLLFSYITYQLIFSYTVIVSPLEGGLWVCSFGYVMAEVIEFFDDPGEYFSTFTNYFDILISSCWMILFVLRFVYQPDDQLKYDSNGELDEVKTRNQLTSEIYMAAWSGLCVLLWSRVVSLFQISRGPGPLIRMILNMFTDIVNFGLICSLFLIGFTFATYFIIAKDLIDEPDVELGTLSSVGLYTFQTLLGQQGWEKMNSVPDMFDATRSNMAISLVLLFSVIGSILLLNLLIAMMASTYENVKEKSNSELNKQRIEKTYELDRSRNVIPPPLNVIAFIFYGYWASFELMAWVLTFGHKQFNEEFMCPLNKGRTQYRVGDAVKFKHLKRDADTGEESVQELSGVVTLRQSVKERMTALSVALGSSDAMAETWTLKVFDITTGESYRITDEQIVSVKKPLFKTRSNRIPNHNFDSRFCKFCRWNLTDGDRMTIEYYLHLFEERGDHIDPDDQKYMIDLLASADQFGLDYVKLCELCPNCYRPFLVDDRGNPDAVDKMLFMLEVISYIVFMMFVWWLLVIVLWVPANISKLSTYLSTVASLGVDSSEDKVRRSAMFRTETNDVYRAKVREASKEEEDQEQVVKRIDRSVDKLQKTLLSKPKVRDDELAGPSELDQDEFETAVLNMRREINNRFAEIKNLLKSIEESANTSRF